MRNMSGRREVLERLKDRQRREQLRRQEAELFEKLKASLGVDPEGGCKALVIRVAL